LTIKNIITKKSTQDEKTKIIGLPLRECLRHFDENKVDEMADF
jgi:hypothetical protein